MGGQVGGGQGRCWEDESLYLGRASYRDGGALLDQGALGKQWLPGGWDRWLEKSSTGCSLESKGWGPRRGPTLCMSTVPQSPRRPAFFRTVKALSSPTTTISTGMPSARACSRARPKLSRSPV